MWAVYTYMSGAYPEIVKTSGAQCRPPWLANEEILGFTWSKKAKITLETIGFWQIFLSAFSKFLQLYIYSESLPMKSYQFLRICKRLDKEREKSTAKSFFYLTFLSRIATIHRTAGPYSLSTTSTSFTNT